MTISWTLLEQYVSKKDFTKKGRKIPLLISKDKSKLLNLNFYFSKWINKDLIPMNIKQELIRKEKDYYILWIDSSEIYLMDSSKYEIESSYKKYIGKEINSFEKKGFELIDIEDEESIESLDFNQFIEQDKIESIFEDLSYSQQDLNINKEMLLNFDKTDNETKNKIKEYLINWNYTNSIFSYILKNENIFNEYKNYLCISKTLGFDNQLKLYNTISDDSYKILATRTDLNPIIAKDLFEKEETKPYILANKIYFDVYYKKTINSLHKNTSLITYRVLLKNKKLNALEIKEIYQKAPKEMKEKLQGTLKEQTLEKLEEANLLEIALSNKNTTCKLFNKSLLTSSYLNTIIIPKIIQTSDLYDKLILILSVLNNRFSKFKEVKDSLYSIYEIFENTIPEEFIELKKEIDKSFDKYDILTQEEYFEEIYTPNLKDPDNWKKYVNSLLFNNIAYTGFWIDNKNWTYLNVIHTKWFIKNNLDEIIFNKLDKNKDWYIWWISSSVNLQSIWTIFVSPFMKEGKEDFFNLVQFHISNIWKGIIKEEKKKDNKFILTAKNPENKREISYNDISYKLWFHISEWDIIANDIEYNDCYIDIRFNIEKYTNLYNLAIEKMLNFILTNWKSKIIDNVLYYLNYSLSWTDILDLKQRLTEEEYWKVFSKNVSINSKYLTFLNLMKDPLVLEREEKIKEGYIRIKSSVELKNLNLWNKYWLLITGEFHYKEDLTNYPNTLEDLHFLIESLRNIKKLYEYKGEYFKGKFIKEKLKNKEYTNDICSVISSSKEYIIKNNEDLQFKQRIYEIKIMEKELLNEKILLQDWITESTIEELFTKRKSKSLDEEIRNFKRKVLIKSSLKDYFDMKYWNMESWFYYLDEKLFNIDINEIVKINYMNTKGIYTMWKIENLKTIAEEIKTRKFEENNFSLWIEDQRHNI